LLNREKGNVKGSEKGGTKHLYIKRSQAPRMDFRSMEGHGDELCHEIKQYGKGEEKPFYGMTVTSGKKGGLGGGMGKSGRRLIQGQNFLKKESKDTIKDYKRGDNEIRARGKSSKRKGKSGIRQREKGEGKKEHLQIRDARKYAWLKRSKDSTSVQKK